MTITNAWDGVYPGTKQVGLLKVGDLVQSLTLRYNSRPMLGIVSKIVEEYPSGIQLVKVGWVNKPTSVESTMTVEKVRK